VSPGSDFQQIFTVGTPTLGSQLREWRILAG
jgi:hypothetical protein